MPNERSQLFKQIVNILESGDTPALRSLLEDQRSSDIAEVVEIIENEQARLIFDALDKPIAAEVLEKVDEATRSELFELLRIEELSNIILEMDSDDAADIISELPDEEQIELLTRIPLSESAEISKLMGYSEDSAGGIMDPVLISVSEDATVSEAIDKIRSAEIDEDFYSVYVINKNKQFVGDVRVRLLLTRPENTKIRELIDKDTIFVRLDTDQEEVRNTFSKNDLIVVPVLDKNHRLVGRITADRVIEVAEEEAAEDLYTMAGTDPEELDKFSAFHAARIRMTWLLPCLMGTGITALVLILFDHKFKFEELSFIYTAAVAFVPMIAAISGNAGLQTSAIVVSGLATGHLAALKFRQVFSRETRIALLVALSCAIIGGVICAIFIYVNESKKQTELLNANSLVEVNIDSSNTDSIQNNTLSIIKLVFAFGIAMFSAIMVATTLGLFLPFLFKKIGIDPAISSGPLVTTANDSISVTIYMTLTLLLAT